MLKIIFELGRDYPTNIVESYYSSRLCNLIIPPTRALKSFGSRTRFTGSGSDTIEMKNALFSIFWTLIKFFSKKYKYLRYSYFSTDIKKGYILHIIERFLDADPVFSFCQNWIRFFFTRSETTTRVSRSGNLNGEIWLKMWPI